MTRKPDQIDRLDQALQKHYGNHSLNPEAVQRLKGLVEADEGHHHHNSNRLNTFLSKPGRKWFLAASAAVLAMLVMWGILFDSPPKDLGMEIAKEIAYNHVKDLKVDFQTADFNELALNMVKLDFALIKPNQLPREFNLMGGRYCSVKGRLAAQLKLNDDSGKISTLFQFTMQDTDPDQSFNSGKYVVNGLEIQLWQEHGVYLGLATQQNSL